MCFTYVNSIQKSDIHCFFILIFSLIHVFKQVEQIPGYVKYADVTAQLRTGHWPSYNVPYFEDIYTLSGYPEIVHAHGIEAR